MRQRVLDTSVTSGVLSHPAFTPTSEHPPWADTALGARGTNERQATRHHSLPSWDNPRRIHRQCGLTEAGGRIAPAARAHEESTTTAKRLGLVNWKGQDVEMYEAA